MSKLLIDRWIDRCMLHAAFLVPWQWPMAMAWHGMLISAASLAVPVPVPAQWLWPVAALHAAGPPRGKRGEVRSDRQPGQV